MIKILCLACVLIVSLSKATPAISESGINKRLLKFQFSLGSLPKFIGSIERLLDKCLKTGENVKERRGGECQLKTGESAPECQLKTGESVTECRWYECQLKTGESAPECRGYERRSVEGVSAEDRRERAGVSAEDRRERDGVSMV
nr:hypothetical protein BaRGS_030515 [Batillaria attramentaria]